MAEIECPECNTGYIPSGSHEDDEGEWTCEECGFRFLVAIEYDPSYTVTCVTHEWGKWETRQAATSQVAKLRWCQRCDVGEAVLKTPKETS